MTKNNDNKIYDKKGHPHFEHVVQILKFRSSRAEVDDQGSEVGTRTRVATISQGVVSGVATVASGVVMQDDNFDVDQLVDELQRTKDELSALKNRIQVRS